MLKFGAIGVSDNGSGVCPHSTVKGEISQAAKIDKTTYNIDRIIIHRA